MNKAYFDWIASETGRTHEEVYAEKAAPTDLKRLGAPDEVARAALFFATGLDDFGDDSHTEGLRVLVEDYTARAGLTGAGNARMRGMVKGLLVAKLMAHRG